MRVHQASSVGTMEEIQIVRNEFKKVLSDIKKTRANITMQRRLPSTSDKLEEGGSLTDAMKRQRTVERYMLQSKLATLKIEAGKLIKKLPEQEQSQSIDDLNGALANFQEAVSQLVPGQDPRKGPTRGRPPIPKRTTGASDVPHGEQPHIAPSLRSRLSALERESKRCRAMATQLELVMTSIDNVLSLLKPPPVSTVVLPRRPLPPG